jgi:DNA replication and repair protein RecF
LTSPLTSPSTRKAVSRQPGPANADGLAPASGTRRTLWLSRLALSNFRCYARAEVEADGRPVVLVGPNGAGKTNLLEAISYLAPGRGLRRAKLSEADRRPAPGARARPGAGGSPEAWAVAATVMTPHGPRELGTGRDPARGPAGGPDASCDRDRPRERRLVKIDGAPARSQQDLGEIVAMVWLSPRMDGLFRDSASAQRRFLDRLVYGFDPAHAARVAAYEQGLRERARLLKAGGADNAWLGALEESMARNGVAIAAARRDTVARLAQACTAGIGPFPVAGLGLAGEVEAALESRAALAVEDEMRARLAAARARDTAAGGAAVGPHRGDLIVSHLERDLPAGLCSTGEQKALLISIVLAHARLLALHRGAAPLLLLDEVAAHLDEVRRRALFGEILELGAQAWLTGTDAAVFAALGERARFFRVHEATVRPAAPPRT